MTMPLVTGPKNDTLRTRSSELRGVTGELRKYSVDMVKTMEAENGVGLAAPQVGRNIRMVICKFNPGEKNEVIVPMINPEILSASDEMVDGEEGCLSLPGVWGVVSRHKSVLVRYTNLKGKEQTLEFHDFNARIVQHEVDHINGVLFIDRAKEIKEGQEIIDGPHI